AEVARLLAMPPPSSTAALDVRGTTPAATEDWYIRARGSLEQGRTPHLDVERLDAAIAAFQQAIEGDAGYAAARGGLSEALLSKYEATKAFKKDMPLLAQ